MNHKHEALWLTKNYRLYMLCTLILFNLLHIIVGSKLILIKVKFEFQNVVVHILRFFAYVQDCQMMPSKFKLIAYYDTSYTSPFLVKIGSPVVYFHPSLNITPLYSRFYPRNPCGIAKK
jgi:hypothetical protein